MKKILLFICMVMCAVGAKAYTTGQTFKKTYYITYSKSSTSGSTSYYSLTIKNMVTDMSSTNCGQYKMNAPTVSYIKRNGTILSCGSYLNPGGLGYYMFHGANVYSSGSDDSKYLQSKLKIEYADCWEYTNDASDYIRFIYPTYETSAYTFEYGMVYTDEHANTYYLTVVVEPINKPRFVSNPTSTGVQETSKTITATSAASGESVYIANSTQTTPSVSMNSAKTFSGSTISSSYYSLSSVNAQTSYDIYYSYLTTFKASKPGIYVLKTTSSSWTSYSTTKTITVNRYTGYFYFPSGNQSKTIEAVRGKNISSLVATSTTSDGTPTFTMTNSDGNAVTLTNNIIPSDLPVGTYTVSASIPQTDSYTACNGSYTLTVTKGTNSLSYTPQEFSARGGHGSFDLPGAISTNNSDGAITYSCTDGNVVINGTKVSFKRPGTYTINVSQAESDTYQAKETSFTITVPTQKLKKVHSCMTNDYHMSIWYDGANANGWTSNTPNLRYVNSGSMLSSEAYIRGGVEALSGNHTVVKFSNEVTTPITSTRMLLDSRNKIVSTNPTFDDSDKYDYVIPGNAEISFVTKTSSAKRISGAINAYDGDGETQKVTYTRTQGIPNVNHYATICLPFSVPQAYMPEGFTFEKHKQDATPEKTDSPTRFTFAFEEVTSLEAGKPYIFKRNDGGHTTLTINVPASQTTFVSQPDMTDPYFYGSFINLIEEDLHAETASNPYNNDYELASTSELDTYFTSLYDESNKRVAYFLKQASDTSDEIRRAGTNVSMRPLRASFRFNSGDFPSAGGSEAKLNIIHLAPIDDVTSVENTMSKKQNDGYVNVYTISGTLVVKHIKENEALNRLASGAYILSNGKKVIK